MLLVYSLGRGFNSRHLHHENKYQVASLPAGRQVTSFK